jgi:hypothetical protein
VDWVFASSIREAFYNFGMLTKQGLKTRDCLVEIFEVGFGCSQPSLKFVEGYSSDFAEFVGLAFKKSAASVVVRV